jgi:hypothetical protein
MITTQRDFSAALLDAQAAVPAGVVRVDGAIDPLRFNVYRNNVQVSLAGALAATFPVVRKLVGAPFFAALARGYIDQHRPASPVLTGYGVHFPAFLAGVEALANLRYLPDVARLEYAWLEAYHAAEAPAVSAFDIGRTDPVALAGSTLEPHPSTRLVASRFPVGSIWHAHQSDPVAALTSTAAEVVLVTRPMADVRLTILPPADGPFAAALLAGKTIAAAIDIASDDAPSFAPAPALMGLVSLGAFTRLIPSGEPT